MMKRRRFTDEQIVAALCDLEAATVDEAARKLVYLNKRCITGGRRIHD